MTDEIITDAVLNKTIRGRIEAIDAELEEIYTKADQKAAPLKARREQLAAMVADAPRPGAPRGPRKPKEEPPAPPVEPVEPQDEQQQGSGE